MGVSHHYHYQQLIIQHQLCHGLLVKIHLCHNIILNQLFLCFIQPPWSQLLWFLSLFWVPCLSWMVPPCQCRFPHNRHINSSSNIHLPIEFTRKVSGPKSQLKLLEMLKSTSWLVEIHYLYHSWLLACTLFASPFFFQFVHNISISWTPSHSHRLDFWTCFSRETSSRWTQSPEVCSLRTGRGISCS